MKLKHRMSGYIVILHLLLVVLAATVLGLVHENRELRKPSLSQTPPSLNEGVSIPTFSARDLDGESRLLNFTGSDREHLLFVFTTVCPVCVENQKNWRALYEQAKDDYEIVGISLNELEVTRKYRKANRLPYPVVIPEHIQEFATQNEISHVPMTIHLGRDGRVRNSWVGLLSDESLAHLPMTSTSAAPTLDGPALFAKRKGTKACERVRVVRTPQDLQSRKRTQL